MKVFEKSSRRVAVVSFVNNINLLTYDIFTKQNCRTLKHLHQKCETWSRRHEVVFASIKYELVHLARNHKRFNMQIELRIDEIQKSSALYVRVLDVQMNSKLKWKSHIRAIQKKNDHANIDFLATYCVYMKSMLRARSSDLFVDHQTRNHLQKLSIIRVARTIWQHQRHDDSAYEDAKNRSAHRLRRLSSHIARDFERRNVYSIHSFSFISFASSRQKSIDKARTLNADWRFLQSNQE